MVALPSSKTFSTQSMLKEELENGAENAESAAANEIPTSAYFIAAQSLAPSPIIPTL